MHQAPGEADAAARHAHAPLRARVRQRERGRGQADARRVVRDARREDLQRARLEPGEQHAPHGAPPVRIAAATMRSSVPGEVDGAPAARDDERDLPAVQGQRLAVLAEKQARLARRGALVQLAQDPARLLVQEALDLAPRRAQGRAHRKAVLADLDGDGAAAPALEAVFHRAPVQQRKPHRRRVRVRRLVKQRQLFLRLQG